MCLLERMTSSVKSFAPQRQKLPPPWFLQNGFQSLSANRHESRDFFSPHQTWVAASMHNGAVQIWDYKLGVRIDSFEEHDGPVRSVVFHPTQPLLASAGDDHRDSSVDYKLRKCIHTFEGHSDYIRWSHSITSLLGLFRHPTTKPHEFGIGSLVRALQ